MIYPRGMVGARLRRTLVAAIMAAALVGAAPAAAQPRIVGGQPATHAYPFAAFVELHYPGSSSVGYCGGSLIAARYVVTAGHCLEDSPNRIDVAVGVSHVDHAHPMASGLSTIPAANQYLNVTAERDPAFGYVVSQPVDDVAILTLPRPAPDAQVRLPRPADAALWAPGAGATAIGWGRCGSFELTCGSLPDDLREVGLPIQPDGACSMYAFQSPSELCAGGEPDKDTCNGDSGSPLLVSDAGGAPVLAGATSFGADNCGNGDPAVYARLGGDDLNRYIRSRVPQVEIDADATRPVPGQTVTFTARPSRPGGTGPFGGYDALSWDLDGNGGFDEDAGQASVQRVMSPGTNTVAVRATDGAGDAEVRTVQLAAVNGAAVSFAKPAVTVVEGRAAVLSLSRVGSGGGSVTVTPSGSPARGATAVAFADTDTTRTVAIGTRDDRATERTRTFRVTLGAFTGALQAGTPATATVTVLDDDPAVRIVASSPGRVRLKADRAGRFTLRGAGLRTTRITLHKAGSRKVRLRPAAGAPATTRLKATFNPSGVGHTVTVRRRVTLRAT
ncbi:MAG: hypothetical protein QOE86_684 [Solirubrobacteraceae bacterium]|nr:hypothetical protein [Solirubrobacteraceae bacterium]